MRWFRNHIRQGSWLALVALAINFAVAFGHVHAIGGSGPERGAGILVATSPSNDGDRRQNHPADGQADYLCPICVAAAAMANALAAAPPALPAEFADVSIDHAIEHAHAIPQPPRAAFQSRGPPVS